MINRILTYRRSTKFWSNGHRMSYTCFQNKHFGRGTRNFTIVFGNGTQRGIKQFFDKKDSSVFQLL